MRYRIVCLTLILTLFALASAASTLPTHPAQVPRIDVAGLKQLLSLESVLFIDTRTSGQWQRAADRIPGAVRLATQTDLVKFISEIPSGTPIVVYCT